jgi:hypothetical protein
MRRGEEEEDSECRKEKKTPVCHDGHKFLFTATEEISFVKLCDFFRSPPLTHSLSLSLFSKIAHFHVAAVKARAVNGKVMGESLTTCHCHLLF